MRDGTPVYVVPASNKDIVTITIAMRTGSIHDTIPGQTSVTAQMLNRGTANMDAATFAEEIERRGCHCGRQPTVMHVRYMQAVW